MEPHRCLLIVLGKSPQTNMQFLKQFPNDLLRIHHDPCHSGQKSAIGVSSIGPTVSWALFLNLEAAQTPGAMSGRMQLSPFSASSRASEPMISCARSDSGTPSSRSSARELNSHLPGKAPCCLRWQRPAPGRHYDCRVVSTAPLSPQPTEIVATTPAAVVNLFLTVEPVS